MIKYLLIFLLIPFSAFAAPEEISLGMGNLTQFYDHVQVNTEGETNKFEFNPFLEAEFKWSFYEDFSFTPELTIGIPRSGRDPLIKKMTYSFSGLLGYQLHDFTFKLGLGFYFTRISSDGGSQVLDNGLGQTSFPMPTEPSTSRNLVTLAGIKYRFAENWSAKTRLLIYNLPYEMNRAYSYSIGINYHISLEEVDWGNLIN